MKRTTKSAGGLLLVLFAGVFLLSAGPEQAAKPMVDIVYNTRTRVPKMAGVTELPPNGSSTRYYKTLYFEGERQSATGPVINVSTNSGITQTRDQISGTIQFTYNPVTDNIDTANNTQRFTQTINTPAPWPYNSSWPAPSPFPLGFSFTVNPFPISYQWFNSPNNPLSLTVLTPTTAGDDGTFNYGVFSGNQTTPTEWIHNWQMELQDEDSVAEAEARAKVTRVYNQTGAANRTSLRGTMGSNGQWTIREVEVRYRLWASCPGNYQVRKVFRKRAIGTSTWTTQAPIWETVTVRDGGSFTRSFDIPLEAGQEIDLVEFGVVSPDGCTIGCNDQHAGSGNGPVNGSIYWPIPLGLMADGRSAGSLVLHEQAITAAIYSPAALTLALAEGAGSVLRDSQGALRQILVPEALVDVIVTGAQFYELHFYARGQAGEIGQDGFHEPTGDPYVVWRIENPDGSGATTDQFKVTRLIGTDELVTEVDESQPGTRIFSEANGLRLTEVEQTTESGDRVERITVRNALNEVASVKKKYYRPFAWGEELVKEILDPDGAALTTQWTYQTSAGNVAYRKMLTKTIPSGFVQSYNYDSQGRQYRYTAPLWISGTRTISHQTVSLTDLNADGIPDELVQVFDQNGQIRISNEFIVIWGSTDPAISRRTIHRARNSTAAWNDTTNIVTEERFDASGNLTYRLSPDGTLLTVSRATDGNGVTTVVERQGVANGSNDLVVDGTNRELVYSVTGQLMSTIVTDIVTEHVLESLQVIETDTQGRPTLLVHTDGAEELRTYCAVCGQVESVTLRGETISFEFDELGRKVLETRSAGTTVLAKTRYKHDADGRLLQTIRLDLQTNAETVLNASVYDLAGRLTNTMTLGQGTTIYGYQFGANNSTVTTTTYADLGTRIETQAASGEMISIRGTATPHFDYNYAPIQWNGGDGYFRQIYARHENNTTTLEQHTINMLGVPATVTLHGGAVINRYYDAKGRLWRETDPDGVNTITAFDAFGRPATRVVDMNANNVINYDGIDRISRTLYEIGERDGFVVRRTTQQVWETDAQDTPTAVSIVEEAVNGLRTWQTVNGLETAIVVAYDNGGGHTVTTTAPDGTITVQSYLGSRLTSTTLTSASSTQLGATTLGYDSNGRVQQSTDARTGATTYTYDAYDRIDSITTPDPDSTKSGAGYDAQVTTYGYDVMGRTTTVTQPDGAVQHTTYYPTGQVKRVWGARTYPVEYTYTLQGLLKTMTTWKDFAGETGQAVTTWNTNTGRGWLTNKRYADNTGPSYTYKNSGRLQRRTWARGPYADYSYNAAGELTGINYSDTTPDVTLTRDRTGRPVAITDGSGTRVLNYHASGQLEDETYTAGLLAGLSVERTYDTLHRLNGLSMPSVYSVTHGYDAASRLDTVTSGTNTATYAYLTNSPLVETVTFKQGGNTRLMTTKVHDKLNRLAAITNTPSVSSAQSVAYAYNSANQRTRATREDDAYWAYDYDALGQVTSGKKHLANDTPVNGLDHAWTFDDIGNRKTSAINGQSATYTTNSLNQYSQRTVPGMVDVLGAALETATVTLTVDGGSPQATLRQGELFYQQVAVNNASAAQTPEIEVLAVQNDAGPNGEDLLAEETRSPFVARTPQAFTHDTDGNLTGDTRWTYTWDAENRLIALETTAAAITAGVAKARLEFGYDGQSRRVAKKVFSWNGSAWALANHTLFLYDGWNMIAEFDALASNAAVRTYVWGLDLGGTLQGAGGVGGLLFAADSSETHTATYDGNGNVIGCVDLATGERSATYEYGAFGETLIADGVMHERLPFRFSTKYTDAESGVLYYGLRYYNPSTGRWLSRDPIEENGGINIYGFVNNNPANAIDVIGLQAILFSQSPVTLTTQLRPMLQTGLESAGPFRGFQPGGLDGAPLPPTFPLPVPVPIIGPQEGYVPYQKPKTSAEDRSEWHAGNFNAHVCSVKKKVAWAQWKPLTKTQALQLLENLKGQFAPSNARQIKDAFRKAEDYVRKYKPASGYYAPQGGNPLFKSFFQLDRYPDRVDIEVITGRAFIDDGWSPPVQLPPFTA